MSKVITESEMQMSERIRERWLKRHKALVGLASYLHGSKESFIDFFKNIFLFEKNVEQGKDPGQAQCNLVRLILNSEQQLRKVIFTQEWQQAMEYLVVPDNASRLLDACYQLEVGNSEAPGKTAQLRYQVLSSAFFSGERQGQSEYAGVPLQFVFSKEIARWSLRDIRWNIAASGGEARIVGEATISVGVPCPDGPALYRTLFAVCGCEKKAAAMLAVQGIIHDNHELQAMVAQVLAQIEPESDELSRWLEPAPPFLKKWWQQWRDSPMPLREFSPAGLEFLTEALNYLEEQAPEGAAWLKQRLENWGYCLEEVEIPNGYDFSDQVAPGDIIRSKPAIKAYWPPENKWQVVFPGKCHFSAGSPPMFLKEIENLANAKTIVIRPEDLEFVKNMLLYICLEGKVPKPPILRVYNALRRWFEALAEKGNDRSLEKLCACARVFRPHIQIPCVGEKPFSIANREHRLLPRLAPEYVPGTIVAIKSAGIMVPAEKMAMFLPGVYWVARHNSPLENLLALIEPLATDADENFRRAWQGMLAREPSADITIILKKLLKDMTALAPEIWENVCKVIAERKGKDSIPFVVHRRLTYEQFKQLDSQSEFRLKIAHTHKIEPGTVISQQPGTKQTVVVVASGISTRLLQAIEFLYKWSRSQGCILTQDNWLDMVRCSFLEFLLDRQQQAEIGILLDFYRSHPSPPAEARESVITIERWQREIEGSSS